MKIRIDALTGRQYEACLTVGCSDEVYASLPGDIDLRRCPTHIWSARMVRDHEAEVSEWAHDWRMEQLDGQQKGEAWELE